MEEELIALYNELYEKIKKYIKENFRTILLFTLLYVLLTYPLPYTIYTTGGIINIADKVSLEKEYQQQGSFNFSYVSEVKSTITTVLLSYIIPSWDLIKASTAISPNENISDTEFRDQMFLTDSIQNATIFIYYKLGKKVDINDKKYYVVYVDKIADTNLKVKDEILAINGNKMKDITDYMKIVNASNYGDELTLQVRTADHVIKNKYVKVLNYQNNKITGIYVIPKIDYETSPKITYHFFGNESGPSGGLMLALTIYNKLTPEDITKGKKIVGTGTIDIKGNIGQISGIEYKLKGAVSQKADLFFAPNGKNYEEAINLKKKYNYKIPIIGVSTFDDALNYLEMM
jgi:PDZ domain-containing protein